MSNIVNLYAEAGANMITDDATPALTFSSLATGGAAVEVQRAVVGSMSIGQLKITGSSLASGALVEFAGKGAFASITSVVLTTVANTDYAIRVQVGLETRWIPLFKDAAIIGAAAFT